MLSILIVISSLLVRLLEVLFTLITSLSSVFLSYFFSKPLTLYRSKSIFVSDSYIFQGRLALEMRAFSRFTIEIDFKWLLRLTIIFLSSSLLIFFSTECCYSIASRDLREICNSWLIFVFDGPFRCYYIVIRLIGIGNF